MRSNWSWSLFSAFALPHSSGKLLQFFLRRTVDIGITLFGMRWQPPLLPNIVRQTSRSFCDIVVRLLSDSMDILQTMIAICSPANQRI